MLEGSEKRRWGPPGFDQHVLARLFEWKVFESNKNLGNLLSFTYLEISYGFSWSIKIIHIKKKRNIVQISWVLIIILP